jgi:hypothetical protein
MRVCNGFVQSLRQLGQIVLMRLRDVKRVYAQSVGIARGMGELTHSLKISLLYRGVDALCYFFNSCLSPNIKG